MKVDPARNDSIESVRAHIAFRKALTLLINNGGYSLYAVDQLRIKHFGSIAAYWA